MTKSKEDKGALSLALASLIKKHGKGSVFLGKTDFPEIGRISSRSIGLDHALNGGWGRGRIVELYGSASSGKTSIALQTVAEIQSLGGLAAFLDAEFSLDPTYAESLGVQLDKLVFSQPECGEVALDIVETLTRTGELDLIVVDSVAALLPRAELEGTIEQQTIGLQARLMSQALRKLAGITHTTDTTLMFLNQTRSKIGGYGNPNTTSGGNSLGFYASQRVELVRTGSTKVGDEVIANTTKAKVVKNKVGPPFKVAFFDIEFGKGINREKELLLLAIDQKIIKKSGAWFSHKEENIGQGEANVVELLRSNPELKKEIENAIAKKTSVPTSTSTETTKAA